MRATPSPGGAASVHLALARPHPAHCSLDPTHVEGGHNLAHFQGRGAGDAAQNIPQVPSCSRDKHGSPLLESPPVSLYWLSSYLAFWVTSSGKTSLTFPGPALMYAYTALILAVVTESVTTQVVTPHMSVSLGNTSCRRAGPSCSWPFAL